MFQQLQFRTKLISVIVVLMVIAIVPAIAALNAVRLSQFHIQRSNLAHDVLDSHLEMAERAQLLLGHLAAPSADPAERAAIRQQLEADIAAEFREVRQLIAAEVALLSAHDSGLGLETPHEEAEELETLAQIEQEMFRAIRVQARSTAPLTGAALEQQDWRRWIDASIAEEKREVDEVDMAAAKTAERLRIIVVSTVSAAVLLALVLAWALLRSLDRPMARLTKAADALAEGDLSTRVSLTGKTEFARLGASFDRMAEELQQQRAALGRSHEVLEAEVAARTAELTAANAQLSAHSETRRRLLTDVSHELRTPLTVVRGEAEVALRGREKSVEDYKSALRRVEEQAGHMGRLVDDLLFVARTASGEVRLQLRAVQLAPLVRRIAADMDLLARKAGGTVTADNLAEGVVVQGDPDRLRQLLLILLDNAIRYSPTGSDVAIELLSSPGGANIRVTDRGIGIPAGELPHVFERFHRASNAVELVEGVGLGLQMAKAIVEAHGGTIMIDSIEGEGTTVSVQLPGGARLRSAA